MNPLVSIIIATKNRVPYCINAIESILAYEENDFELIIQDNTDTIELKEYVENHFTDKRMIYRYTPPPFSSIDNFNAGLELANGEYVCLIGDDDGICSGFFEAVRWAKNNNIDSICPKVFIDYYWPGAVKSDGYMTVPAFTQKAWSELPSKQLQPLVDDGIVNYMAFNLPKFYHGIIRKYCLEQIKKKNGYYIGGLSPDIYSAVSLANIVKSHIVLDFPITISGACKVSTTVAGINGGHSGKLSEAPHFRHRGVYVWDLIVPAYYSVQTIWAESAIKAIKENNIPVSLDNLNVKKVFAKSVIAAPSHYSFFENELLKVSPQKSLYFRLLLVKYAIGEFLSQYFQRIKNRIVSKLSQNKIVRVTPVENILEATKTANLLLKQYSVNECLSKGLENK